MKKNLITLAIVGAALVPTLASAGVTVYGRAQVEIASHDDGTDSNITVLDNSMGRIGVKATEDLGGGLTGLAKFEMKADTADGDVGKCASTSTTTVEDGAGTATSAVDAAGNPVTIDTTSTCSAGISLSARESMVGLKGGFGQVELGALKSEYKYNGGVKYDAFVATNLEARGNGGMSKPADTALGTNGFITKSIAYRGKAGPVKFGLTYAPSENDGRMSFGVKFGAKNYEAFLAGVDAGDTVKSGVVDYSATKLGGMYKMGAHKVMLQLEQREDASGVEPANTFLGYQGKFGKNTAVFQYGMEDKDNTAGDETTMITLGVIHKFSKSTRIFGGYRNSDTENNAGATTKEDTRITVGLRKDFK